MTTRRFLGTIAGALCGLAGLACLAVAAEELQSARSLLRDAYLAVVQAELAQVAGSTEEAASAYRQALQLFDTLVAQYPGWQGELVSFRAAECQNRIQALQSAGIVQATNAVSAEVGALAEELKQLRAILGEPEAGGESAVVTVPDAGSSGEVPPSAEKAQIKALQAERDAVAKDNQALLKAKAKLEVRLAKLEKKSGLPPEEAPKLTASVIKLEARRLLNEKENDAAVTLLQEAAGLIFGDEEIVLLLATAYCHAGRFAEAIPLLKGMIQRLPERSSAWILLGTADMGLGRLGDARVAMEEALKRPPESSEAHYNLAQILMALQPPDLISARLHYSKALALGMPADEMLEGAIRRGMMLKTLEKKK